MVLVAVGVLLGLVALLAVPVGVAFRLEGPEPLAGRVTIRWLFGLVRVRVPVPGPRKRPAEAAATKRKRAPRKTRRRGARVLAALRLAEFRERALRLAEDLVRAAHVRGLRLRMRLGLGDPADTGRLWAVVGPLAAISQVAGADVWIEPEFVDPVLEFQARGRLLVVPLQVLALAVAFVLSPASIRAWRAARSDDA